MSRQPDIAAGRLTGADLDRNFADLAPPLTKLEARVAAERCLYCYGAPCQTACPTSIDIPLFIRQIATGNPLGAARTILDANIFGAMCARVCPTETLCEEACVREAAEGKPVEIGRLQRHATDALMADGRQFYRRGAATGRNVAVVGAGPAGLACAHKLATLGHAVTVLEARAKAGGLNEYGLAAYKATNAIAAREIDYILGVGGICVSTGKALGRDFSLGELRESHDAVFLAIGLGDTNPLGLGDGLSGVIDAVDFIAELRQASDKASLPVGRKVVVIGGGMTAIDIATQVKRLGAEDVTIAYRRTRAEMGASGYEQDVALASGVAIRASLMPKRLVGADGAVVAIELERTRTEAGKLVGTGELETLACDQLFIAIGQSLVTAGLVEAGIRLEKGRVVVDAEGRTSAPGIWAGGDCVLGGKDLTVAAVEDGKQAALSIDRALSGAGAIAAE
ncbi:MAG: NAD(P)-dependent oxidoreductase [Hyphomicrobiaceae bacterium]|nr:NAD(P)-dependent oxidoreductase [Hyphomicrobiaceae bacterium]